MSAAGPTERTPLTGGPPAAAAAPAPAAPPAPAEPAEPEPAQALDWGMVTVLLLCIGADTLSVAVVYPVTPWMIARFLGEGHEAEIGYYVGAVATAHTIGSVVAGAVFGWLSDHVGRRPVMLGCMGASALLLVAFGCSQSVEWALGARFLQGCFAGNIVTAKAALTDIVDPANSSRVWSLVGVMYAVGAMLGSALGGLLAEPAASEGSLLDAFPFLLPTGVAAAVIVLDLLVAALFLREPRRQAGRAAGRAGWTKRTGARALLHQKQYLRITSLFMLFGLAFQSAQEVLPVWARTPRELGGAGYGSTAALGLARAFSSCMSLVTLGVVYPRLCDRYGPVVMFRLGVGLLVVSFFWPPLISAYADPQHWLSLGVLGVGVAVMTGGQDLCFAAGSALWKASLPPHLYGVGIGMGSSFGSVASSLGPVGGASLFAWSVAQDEWPAALRNGRLFYFAAELVALATLSLSFRVMPRWPWRTLSTDGFYLADDMSVGPGRSGPSGPSGKAATSSV